MSNTVRCSSRLRKKNSSPIDRETNRWLKKTNSNVYLNLDYKHILTISAEKKHTVPSILSCSDKFSFQIPSFQEVNAYAASNSLPEVAEKFMLKKFNKLLKKSKYPKFSKLAEKKDLLFWFSSNSDLFLPITGYYWFKTSAENSLQDLSEKELRRAKERILGIHNNLIDIFGAVTDLNNKDKMPTLRSIAEVNARISGHFDRIHSKSKKYFEIIALSICINPSCQIIARY